MVAGRKRLSRALRLAGTVGDELIEEIGREIGGRKDFGKDESS